jgi:hypothetical protein
MEVISSLYEKLEEGSLEIRLLETIPSIEEHEMLKLRLHTVSLKDDPKYTALSYVWGDPAITENVILNGEAITIGANLASAMRHLRAFLVEPEERHRGEQDLIPFRLWADALCINQKDILEWNSQVQLMANIYRSAATVISWLGTGDEQMARVFRTIFETHNVGDTGIST